MDYNEYDFNRDYFLNLWGFCPMNQLQPNIIFPIMDDDIYRIDNGMKAQIEEQVLKPQTFKISYPIVRGIGNAQMETVVNSAILDEVGNLFRQQILLPDKVEFAAVDGFYEIALNEEGLLSILFGLNTYVSGAAHGYTAYSSLTIDFETGKVYEFGDLFNSKVYYKGIIDEIAKKYISDNDIPLIAEYDGVTPDQQFYLTPDSLVLYYQIYEYTPYAYGLFKIPIPYTEIESILGPLSPIQRLL